MPGADLTQRPTRLWCIAARDAPIVAVIARCTVHGDRNWTHILRWNWKTRKVEHGAWTKLKILGECCALTPNGEFLLYWATGPDSGPFSSFITGGAAAVSRLPWLAALTDPDPHEPSLVTSNSSRDALSRGDQEQMWNWFRDWPKRLTDEHWPLHLGPGWSQPTDPIPVLLQGIEPRGSRKLFHLAATHQVPNRALTLIAVVDPDRGTSRAPDWSVWHSLRYFVKGKTDPSIELTDVRWAYPGGAGCVLAATTNARLQVLQFRDTDDTSVPHKTTWEADLSNLQPDPQPAPDWAKAPLAAPPRRRTRKR